VSGEPLFFATRLARLSAGASPEALARGSREVAGNESVVAERAARMPATSATSELFILVEPADARVSIDGVFAGSARVVHSRLDPGSYTVTASRDGYESASRQVALDAGDSRTVEISLTPGEGTLLITVRPWGSIFVDDELKVSNMDVQYSTVVRAGTRRVRATHPELGTREVTVDVRAGTTSRLEINLLP
jgi:hypothetical protein